MLTPPPAALPPPPPPRHPTTGQPRHPRKPDGTFAKGAPGRPKGISSQKAIAGKLFDEMIAGDGPEIVRKAIEVALSGNSPMLIHMLSRLSPVRKGRLLDVKLPAIKSIQDALGALSQVTADVSAGKLTTDEAQAVAELLRTYIAASDVADLAKRIEALEASNAADTYNHRITRS